MLWEYAVVVVEPSPSDEIITGAERLTMEGVMYASSHFRGMVSSSLAFRLERLREKKKHKMKEARRLWPWDCGARRQVHTWRRACARCLRVNCSAVLHRTRTKKITFQYPPKKKKNLAHFIRWNSSSCFKWKALFLQRHWYKPVYVCEWVVVYFAHSAAAEPKYNITEINAGVLWTAVTDNPD